MFRFDPNFSPQRVCHDTMPWLISVSLGDSHFSANAENIESKNKQKPKQKDNSMADVSTTVRVKIIQVYEKDTHIATWDKPPKEFILLNNHPAYSAIFTLILAAAGSKKEIVLTSNEATNIQWVAYTFEEK
jgi:hypothetical protein